MEDIKDIKRLVRLYFEGKADDEQAQAVAAFMSRDEQSEALFRTWESEWAAWHTPDAATNEAWKEFQNRISVDGKCRPRRLNVSRTTVWKIAAVAAVALLLLGIGLNLLPREASETLACSTEKGGKAALRLPDGTQVWLGEASTLEYPERFSGKERHVRLSGEALFQVAKDIRHPFIVQTSLYDVRVTGTCFKVADYAEDEESSTVLYEGGVDITLGGSTTTLRPGEQISCDRKSEKLTKTATEQSADDFKAGKLVCKDIGLKQLARVLSRRYAVDVQIKSPEAEGIGVSLVLQNNETIDEVISALRLAINRPITRNGSAVVIE